MSTLCKKANLLPRNTIAKRISKARKPSNTTPPKQLSHTTAPRRQAKSFKDLSTLLQPKSSNPKTVILLDDDDGLNHSSNPKTVILLDDDDGLNHSSNPKTVILLDNDDNLNQSLNPKTVILLDDDDSINHSSNQKTVILLDDDHSLNHSSNPKTVIVIDDGNLNHSVSYPPFINNEFIFKYANQHHLLLPQNCDSVAEFPTLLPPNSLNQKTVVLDLDETLIHSTIFRNTSIKVTPPVNYDFLVSYGRKGAIAYVTKRPFVDEFLQYLKQNNFEIVIFTAGSKSYASPVLDKLDPNRFISHRLYRDSRKLVKGKYHVKDLSNLGRDLKNVVIVDDRPISYALQLENGIPLKHFIDDLQDNELKKLMGSFFKSCDQYEDLKDAVRHFRALNLKLRFKYFHS